MQKNYESTSPLAHADHKSPNTLSPVPIRQRQHSADNVMYESRTPSPSGKMLRRATTAQARPSTASIAPPVPTTRPTRLPPKPPFKTELTVVTSPKLRNLPDRSPSLSSARPSRKDWVSAPSTPVDGITSLFGLLTPDKAEKAARRPSQRPVLEIAVPENEELSISPDSYKSPNKSKLDSPPPCDPAQICYATTTVFFQDQANEPAGGSLSSSNSPSTRLESPRLFSRTTGRRTSSGGSTEPQEIVRLDPTVTTRDVILSVLKRFYGQDILSKPHEMLFSEFGLYEAEMVEDDHDNVSLFQPDESGHDLPAKPYRRSSAEFAKRRIVRVLRLDEIPLFVYHNWKFYSGRPNIRSRRPSLDVTKPKYEPRHLHFLVKRLSSTDTPLINSNPNLEDLKTEDLTQTSDILRSQHYRLLPPEKLYKRLSLLKYDELQEIKEVEQRYRRQMKWITASYACVKGYI